jgi:hypothetical protein
MPRSTQPPSRVPVVLSAVGAAVFLGLGVGLHAYWQLAAHDYNTQCAPDSATPSCSDERTRGTLAAGFAFGSYAVAAALAVTTIVLLARPGAPPRETARAGAFSCAPGLGAAVCTVTF